MKNQDKKDLEILEKWVRHLKLQTHYDREYKIISFIEKQLQKVPKDIRDNIFKEVDQGYFYMYHFINSSQLQSDFRNKIIESGKIFHNEIRKIEDMKKLKLAQIRYIVDYEIAKHRLLAATQGAMVGTSYTPLLLSDIPVNAAINLKAIQCIANTYGYNTYNPFEMMILLRVYQASILPENLLYIAFEEIQNEISKHDVMPVFFEGSEELTNTSWLVQSLRYVLKGLCLYTLRNKKVEGIPILGIGIGGLINYHHSKKITEFAHNFYQYRFLKEKLI